jgi:hypothetical protein
MLALFPLKQAEVLRCREGGHISSALSRLGHCSGRRKLLFETFSGPRELWVTLWVTGELGLRTFNQVIDLAWRFEFSRAPSVFFV